MGVWERQQGDSDRVRQQGEGKAAGRGQASPVHVLVLPCGGGSRYGFAIGEVRLIQVGCRRGH
jgi:hypothetical protein